MSKIRRYFQDYVKYFPNEWEWNLSQGDDSRERYMRFRARKGSLYSDKDIIPLFDSIERDANRFNLSHIEYIDFFGIKWVGDKGRLRYVGDADYDQHLYYCNSYEDEDDEEDSICVSEDYTATNPPPGFVQVEKRGVKEFIDVDNAVDLRYNFIVENHLFKDSCVVLSYDKPIAENDRYGDKCESETTFDIIGIAKGLHDKRPDLYKKLLERVQEHFEALQNSDRAEEREYAPVDDDGKFKTAEQYFDYIFKQM